MIEVQQILDAQTEEGLDKPPYIFNVPKALKSIKPEGYTPQLLSLGPYHRYRDDLYEMERFKVLTVRKVLMNHLTRHKFEEIVRHLAPHEAKIRSRYEKYLRMSGVELVWILGIDGIFLLQFLQTCSSNEEYSRSVLNVSPRLSFMVDSKGHTKPSYDLLIRDAMMLENQVPIYVLKRILELEFDNLDKARDILAKLFLDMCKKICPFRVKADQLDRSALKSKGTFLGFVYSLINPMWDKQDQLNPEGILEIEVDGADGSGDGNGVGQGHCSPFINTRHHSPKKVFGDLWDAMSQLPIFKQGPLKMVSVLKDVMTKVLPHLTSNNGSQEDLNNEGDTIIQVEEIEIPSVSILVIHGVEFKPAKGGLDSIKYDTKTQTFELPTIRLDVNSEVIIRNLVAYEAMAIPGPQVLARYAELMNGIVDTEEDAKILKKKGIIEGELKNQDVANLWNGMSKCIRVTRVDFIDKAIENVNKEFSSIRTVKIYRRCKAYIYGSWKMIMFLATLLVICLMLLQSFCTVYSCPRLFHLEAAKK
ncbi:hypothetical protein RND81_13G105000 [Saponaria officinalis]|uniref:Uncharacterized protein n=1 Tax=Saponaria officinalis TaxID=3572 RepID=A0AAW1GW15_SAPOF